MDNVKNDNYYIQKIRQDLEFIVIHMKDVDIRADCTDEKAQNPKVTVK